MYLARGDGGGQVAVKVARADAGAAARLAHEAEILRGLAGARVPAVLGEGATDDVPRRRFLVLEYVEAPTLETRLARGGGALELAEVPAAAAAIAAALDGIHARGVVHRDLKPANVFVAARNAWLCDFGVARRVADADADASAAIVGSAVYMAPEQCAGEVEVGPAADVYALGVILFEALTGRPPFVGGDAELRVAHAGRRAPRASELAPLPRAVDAVLARALAKEPSRRFARASELAEALATALEGTPTPTPTPVPVAGAAGGVTARRRVRVALLLAAGNRGGGAAVVAEHGGEVAVAGGGRLAAVFEAQPMARAILRARRAGEALLAGGAIDGARIEVADVVVREAAGGARRFASSLFAAEHAWPDGAAAGVVVAPSARRASEPARDPRAAASDEPPLGRDALLDELGARVVRATATGAPAVITVHGSAGAGLSTIATALGRRLAAAGLDVIALAAAEPIAGEPNATLGRLAALLDVEAGASADETAALRAFLGLAGDGPAHLAAVPGAVRDLAVHAVARALRTRARAGGVALVVDDAHFADAATIAAIEEASLAEHRARLALVLVRRGEPGRTIGAGAAACASVAVPPLAAEACRALARRLLAPVEEVPADALDELVDRAGGQPGLLVELTAAIHAAGLIRRRPGGAGWFLATDELGVLADAPVDRASRALDALPGDLVAHARLAAVLGPRFSDDDVEGVIAELERDGDAGALPLDPRVASRRLARAGILTPASDARDLWCFASALLRDALARDLHPEARRRIHAAAVRHLDQRGGPDVLARLGPHLAAAGLAERAAATWLALAERAATRHAYLEAETLYTSAAEMLGDDGGRLRAHRGRALMRQRLARYEDALADLQLAAALAERLGDRDALVHILLDQATAHDWLGDYAAAAASGERAAALAGDAPTAELRARLRFADGRRHQLRGELAAAADPLAEAADLAAGIGDAAYETLVAADLVRLSLLAQLGRLDQAQAISLALEHRCRRRADRIHLAATLGNRLVMWLALDRPEAAIADLEQGAAIARELGLVMVGHRADVGLVNLHYQLGDDRGLQPALARALAAERHGVGASGYQARLMAARVHAWAGREELARAALAEVAAAASVLHELDALAASAADLATRDAADDEWDRLIAGADPSAGDELWELRGLAALRRGRRAEARRCLTEAARAAEAFPGILGRRIARELAALDEGTHDA